LKSLYDAGEVTFFGNMGHLSKPVTKDNYFTETNAQLFSHFGMMEEAQYVDAFRENAGTGVVGRMLDKLQLRNYAVSSISIDSNGFVLEGNSNIPRSVDVIGSFGIDDFYQTQINPTSSTDTLTMKDHLKNLNGETTPNSGLFGDHWSKTFVDSVDKSASLKAAVDNVITSTDFPNTNLGRQLKMVAKLVTARGERGVNRDAFYVRRGGFDTHSLMKDYLDGDGNLYDELNAALESFDKEMKSLGLENNVTLVLTSEFARVGRVTIWYFVFVPGPLICFLVSDKTETQTLSPNSGGGTDHAWGGNYFMMGGAVKGGRILGEYPQGFGSSDPTNDGRGRLIPTT
jgi:uncharacterized protein (DUF1501 family)